MGLAGSSRRGCSDEVLQRLAGSGAGFGGSGVFGGRDNGEVPDTNGKKFALCPRSLQLAHDKSRFSQLHVSHQYRSESTTFGVPRL